MINNKQESDNLKNFKKLVSDETSGFMKDFIKEKETIDEFTEKSSLYNEIYSIVKQIPRKETNSDAMDYPSATSSIEELFHKWKEEPKQETENFKK